MGSGVIIRLSCEYQLQSRAQSVQKKVESLDISRRIELELDRA